MDRADQYRLSQYQFLKFIDEKGKISLKRNELDGRICVEKHIDFETEPVYQFLKTHPNAGTPEIYECVEDEEYVIVLEEYVTGETLEQLRSEREFSQGEAADIIFRLCQILEPLHQANPPIVCRDLKAENVIVDREGELKIIDFDIARVYRPGQNRDTHMLGTQEYAAPEQFGYQQTDPRTDIYALGVLLNYLVLGKFLFEQKLQGPLGTVVEKCTRMDPDQRYQTVGALALDLQGKRKHLDAGVESGTSRGQNKNSYSSDYSGRNHSRFKGTNASSFTGTTDSTERKQDVKKVKEQKKSAVGAQSYCPPGFRTRTPWKMVVAVCGYIFLTYFCFTLQFDTEAGMPLTGFWLWVERFLIWFSQLIFIALVCNYRGWREGLPLLRSQKRIVRIIGYCFAEILLFAAVILILTILDMIFLFS